MKTSDFEKGKIDTSNITGPVATGPVATGPVAMKPSYSPLQASSANIDKLVGNFDEAEGSI